MPEFRKPETKLRIRAEMKQTDLQGNRLRGAAAVLGNMDYGDDVIFPGAFKTAIPDFLKSGFVAEGHDWYELPIAMPISAEEMGNALMTEAEFHTTDEAQAARTVCMERLARDLTVGLSVGFRCDPNGSHYFENGENLLTFAKDNGYDMKLFDTKGIMACDCFCRGITKVEELFEYSIVTVPMNPMAVVTDAKEFDLTRLQDERSIEAFLREAGLSRANSKKFISISKGIFLQRDAGSDDSPLEATPDEEPGETPAPETDAAPADDNGEEGKPDAPIIMPTERRIRFTLGGKVSQCQPYVSARS